MKINKKVPKVRKTWGQVKPVTQVVDSDKKYKRSREKRNTRRELFDCMG